MDEPVTYEVTTDFEWTIRAYQSLEASLLHGEVFVADGVVSSHVWGQCPRCEHSIDVRQVHTAVVTGPSRTSEQVDEPPSLPVDVPCECKSRHEPAPRSESGCGVTFRVELVLP